MTEQEKAELKILAEQAIDPVWGKYITFACEPQQVIDLFNENAALQKRVEELEPEHAEMLAMLKKLEWMNSLVCTRCNRYFTEGHLSDCSLGNLIKKMEKSNG